MVAGVVLVTLSLVGCGSDVEATASAGSTAVTIADPPSTAIPRAATTSTAEPAPTDEQAVLAAVDCYWATLSEANDPPDPDHPGYQACFTGDARQRAIAGSLKYLAAGQRVRNDDGYVRSGTTIVSVSETTALVAECFVDDAIVLTESTGDVVNSTTSSRDIEFDLIHEDETWKVSMVRGIKKRQGANVCPES